MRATCVFAVASLITSRSQISGFESPRASRSSTSRSRGGQLLDRRGRCRLRGGALPRELLDDGARDRRREERLAARDDPDCGGDLLRRRVLQHEPARARSQRVEDVRVESEGRQDQDARGGLGADDPPGRLDPVEHRHADVHQHDVGPQPPRRCDRVLSIAGLCEHGQLGLALEDLAQADPDERLVVGDQDGRHRIGSRTWIAKPPPARRPASSRPP